MAPASSIRPTSHLHPPPPLPLPPPRPPRPHPCPFVQLPRPPSLYSRLVIPFQLLESQMVGGPHTLCRGCASPASITLVWITNPGSGPELLVLPKVCEPRKVSLISCCSSMADRFEEKCNFQQDSADPPILQLDTAPSHVRSVSLCLCQTRHWKPPTSLTPSS